MCNKAEGIDLYLAKRRCDEITSCFVATKTNLIPSNSLAHAEGGMASTDSESSSLFLTTNTLLTGLLGKGTVRLSSNDTTVSKLLTTERECPRGETRSRVGLAETNCSNASAL